MGILLKGVARIPYFSNQIYQQMEPRLSWMLMTSNVPGIAYCLQVSEVVIYTLLKKAHIESGSALSVLD